MSVNGTLVEAKLCTFTLVSTHCISNKCSILTHDGASAKFSSNSDETDYSVILAGLSNRRCRWHRRIIYQRCRWHRWTVFQRCRWYQRKILGFLVIFPWQGFIFRRGVDTAEQFIAGVVDTSDKYSFANISVNFRKNSNRPQWYTWGHGGHWFMKKTGSRKSRVRLPLKTPYF